MGGFRDYFRFVLAWLNGRTAEAGGAVCATATVSSRVTAAAGLSSRITATGAVGGCD